MMQCFLHDQSRAIELRRPMSTPAELLIIIASIRYGVARGASDLFRNGGNLVSAR